MLKAAGLLAHAPIDLGIFQAALGAENDGASEIKTREVLRPLVQLGLLRLIDDSWQISHALAYQFVRSSTQATPGEILLLAKALASRGREVASSANIPNALTDLRNILEHLSALLPNGEGDRFWPEQEAPWLRDLYNHLKELNQLRLSWQLRDTMQAAVLEGDHCQKQGNFNVSRTEFKKALQLAQNLTDIDSSDTTLWFIFRLRTRVTRAFLAQSDSADANTAWLEAARTCRQFSSAQLLDFVNERGLLGDLNRTWELLKQHNATDGSTDIFHLFSEISQRLEETSPSNFEWQKKICSSQYLQGDYLINWPISTAPLRLSLKRRKSVGGLPISIHPTWSGSAC